MNCENNFDELCDKCSSCTKFKCLQHPNLKIIVPLPSNNKTNKDGDPLDSLTKEDFEYLTNALDLKSTNPFYNHMFKPTYALSKKAKIIVLYSKERHRTYLYTNQIILMPIYIFI